MAEMSIVDAFGPPTVIDSANWTILHPCLPAEGIGLTSSIHPRPIHVYLFKMGPTKKNRDPDK
jgi:hypothetical protein